MKPTKKPYRPPKVRSEKILVPNLFASSDFRGDDPMDGKSS
jgi:hypothetical protein